MTIQYSDAVNNARTAAYESTIGTSPQLRFYTGAKPAAAADAASGTLLATLTLPSDWMGAPSAGTATKAGTWTGTGAAAGDAGYYRIYDSTGVTCHEQGTVTITGGGGDLIMTAATTGIVIGQALTVSTWSKGST